MTNDNRVSAGVPTGGEFATGAKAENDDLTPPTVYSTPEFEAVYVDENGSQTGDCSVGHEVSVCREWATGDPEEPYISCEHIRYVNAVVDNDYFYDYDANDPDATEPNDQWGGEGALYFDQWKEAMADPNVAKHLKYRVATMISWHSHSNPEDAGSSEIDADYEYLDGDADYDTLEDANAVAKAEAEAHDWSDTSPDDWPNR